MRQKELFEYHSNYEAISPEAYMAQRMAELENLAKYRAEKLQKYKDWVDPVKRAKIQEEYAINEREGRTKLVDIPAELVAVRTGRKYFEHLVSHTKPAAVAPKPPTWFQRIKKMIMGFVHR